MLPCRIAPADYDAFPALRRSDFALFLDSPERYEYHVVRGNPRKATTAMEFGTTVDRALLVPHWRESIVEIPDDVLGAGGRRAGARWKEYEAAHAGAVLCKPGDPLLEIAAAVARHTWAAVLLDTPGECHAGAACVADGALAALGPIKAQLDKLLTIGGRQVIVDIKTTSDASPRGFALSVAKYGYHIQQEWYRAVHRAAFAPGDAAFVFLALQTTPPYRVEVYELDPRWGEVARDRISEAAPRFAACVADGVWGTAASGQVVTLAMPDWVARDGLPIDGGAATPTGDSE